MSTPANVLAVMYWAATEELPLMAAVDMWDARDAVAELIEALTPINREVPRLTREEHERILAALARVGGAR